MLRAYLDSANEVTVKPFRGYELNHEEISVIQQKNRLERKNTVISNGCIHLKFSEDINLNASAFIEYCGRLYPLLMGRYIQSIAFDLKYSTDVQMGAVYSSTQTVFRVFAPTAVDCRLLIDHDYHEMVKINGYFEATVDEDCHGRHYHYEVSHNDVTHFVIDPYVKGVSANSKEAMVIDFERINPGYRTHAVPNTPNKDAIIYEAHIRDMTIHPNSGVKKEWQGKYLGMAEHAFTKHGLSSGLNYVKELGVTHIELMPVNDFLTVDELNTNKSYNWGYDPKFFMVPEGSYSTDPKNPIIRILELQKLIKKLHENGMKVIFDVVLNHVYEVENSSFEKLVPGYYFRHNDDLSLSNGTGVGNDFASEKLMGRRFIHDTISFWLDYYRVDGYRFDLMGAIDIETMQGILNLVKERNREILLLGEGWDLPTALDHSKKTLPVFGDRVPSLRFFNDHFRDAIKGNNFELMAKGYVNGDGTGIDKIRKMFTGFYEEYSADMSINYVEVHDNHTLYDRLRYSSGKRQYVLESQHQLATALVLLSFGTPFLHAGQEFFRTKFGHGNTYNLSDMLNRMDWNRRAKYQDNIEFVKSLIEFRKSEPVFRLKDKDDIENAVSTLTFDHLSNVFGVRISYEESDFIIMINPTETSAELSFGSDASYKIRISNQRNVDKAIYRKSFYIKGYEVAILVKTDSETTNIEERGMNG
ncbi:type I pullulanase [Salinicoccus halodurans]|uniref:Pullulanase n=1 Tax=Salinicoccus halodurans TaxID=407035 RepID=A0AA94HC45_9STAP|nr:type I pullulanase [Salinicoccus halodurans]SFK54914.1 pullulanase [Salinicoccus halodurans]